MTELTATNELRLPETPEGIDADWLTAALSRMQPGLIVKSAKHTQRIDGASTKLRMSLETEGSDFPPSILIKAGYQPHSASMLDMHQNEFHAYRDLIPTLDVNAPKCFFAGEDATGYSMVIIEDLDLRGAKFQSLQHPLDFKTAAGFVEGMARYHARWWGADLDTLFPWAAGPMDMRNSFYFDILLTPEKFEHYVRSPRGAAMPRQMKDPARIARGHNVLTDSYLQMPLTMQHGDTHLGNLYTDADGTPGFLDWMPRKGPYSLDFTYFIIAATDVEDRRRWEGALIQHYLHTLRGLGVDAPTFDEAFDAYRRDVIWGLLIWFLNGTEFQTESNNTAAATRFGMAMLDHETFARLGV